MKIVLPGGSGQIGTLLARHFAREHDVVALGRAFAPGTVLADAGAGTTWRGEPWDGVDLGAWAGELEGADVVLNLAGRSVDCRYTSENRRRILESRVQSTRALGQAIAACAEPPPLWLQASTATIYAHRFDAANDDLTGIVGGLEPDAPSAWRFSIEVALAWEAECLAAATPRTRRVLLRSAMTMSPDPGGVFDVLLGLVRRGLGGTSGSGEQYVSWIHEADFIAALQFWIERDDLDGPVNLAAPEPLPNKRFMAELRRAWGTRIGLPASRWMLELGAVFLRTETELVLKSRRVVPGRLTAAGFRFEHPAWPAAATDLVARWRERR